MNNPVMQYGELERGFNMIELRFDIVEVMEKAIGGRQRRLLGGYAAGTTPDFQDETFLMKGMDFSYLASPQGRVNWDHNTQLILGRPIQSGMFKKGLYVKGMLSEKDDYPDVSHPDTIAALDRAEWAWDHAMRFKADPESNAPLAWSVEGKKMNKGGVIVKSLITDVALTDKAVNPHDCTVSAMAKSLREQLQTETTEMIAVQSGLSPEEINNLINDIKDGDSLINFFKSIGLSADQSKIFYKNVRSINGERT